MKHSFPILLALSLTLLIGCKDKGASEVVNNYLPNPPGNSGGNGNADDEEEDEVISDTTDKGCPGGFIRVPKGSTGHVANDFCVMKYEARNDGLNGVSVKPSHYPWVNVPAQGAKDLCQSLGSGFDLISNDEWMTIILNAEANVKNWTGGALYSGQLNKGHTDSVPLMVINISDKNNYYDQTGNTNNNQKRIQILSNDEIIWDINGNAKELVDWSDGVTYTLPPTCTSTSQLQAVGTACPNWSDTNWYRPLNPTTLPNVYGHMVAVPNAGYGIVLTRGGGYSTGTAAGLFGLELMWENLNRYDDWTGFRCVFRNPAP